MFWPFCASFKLSTTGVSMPIKDLPESGCSHLLQQLIVVSEVHAGFRSKCERILVARRPFGQHRHQQPDVFLVTDKIVVNDEDLATPANPQQFVQLGDEFADCSSCAGPDRKSL